VFVASTYISFPGVENFYTLHKSRTFEAQTGMNPIFIVYISSMCVVNVSDMTVCKKVTHVYCTLFTNSPGGSV